MPLRDDLNYEVSGDRRSRAVLLLHGFMGSSADWRGVMSVIGDRAFCIAVDLPGHGSSLGLSPETYTITGATLAVIDALDKLEVERPSIASYSMGGRLALYLALRYPERCSGLFLESASPGLEGAEQRSARAARRMSRRRSAWNQETSKRFFMTGTTSRSSRLLRGTRGCCGRPSRRVVATILGSLPYLFGRWERGASLRCGESWRASPCLRSLWPEGWMRSTPRSHLAWRASARGSNPW